MEIALGLGAVLVLILANGYFVAEEFAYVAARRSRLEQAAATGDRRAARAVDVNRRLSFMLSGAQLGITATSLIAGFIAGPTVGRALEPLLLSLGLGGEAGEGLSLTLAFLLVTGTQMVLGELAPKNLAIARPERVAIALARSTTWYLAIAGPLIRLFDGSANRLLSAFGVEAVEELSGATSAEDLQRIIDVSSQEGTLAPAQAALLGRALEFRALRTADAMVPRPRVVAVKGEATGADLRRLATASGHSRFPVVGAGLDDVLGVVQAKDLLGIPLDERDVVPVRRLLQPALAVPDSARLGPLLADMRRAQRTLAVVIDEFGGTAGIITLEDIVEELIGSIQDEYDPAEPAVQRLAAGDYLVPGSLRMDEIVRETGIGLPEGDWDTLGGLVMAELGRVPAAGDTVLLEVALLRVETMRGMAVAMVRLSPARGAGDES